MKIKHNYLPLLLLIIVVFSQSCGSGENITVVQDTARTGSPADTSDVEDDQSDFQHITLGLIEPVTNLDPLFADNLSTMRVLSLIYDGLYTLNADGEPVPSLAENVAVSENGMEYLFTINRNLFYHNSNAFVSGMGRKVNANDIKWAFERAAQNHVPPLAAKLLMNIKGFENYFLEQRTVYDEEKRVLDDVDGIQVVSQDSLKIILNEEDPEFLSKLASPFLYIYPREALQSGNLNTRPVGTGPYTHNQTEQDRIILSRNRSELAEIQTRSPRIDRVDFKSFESESDLFQQLAREEIDWIPELGPKTTLQTVDEENELISSYRDSYSVSIQNTHRITEFYLNPNSTSSIGWLSHKLESVSESDFSVRGEFRFNFNTEQLNSDSTAAADSVYYLPYTTNPFSRQIFSDLQSEVFSPESSIKLFDITIPTRETALYSKETDPLHKNWIMDQNNFLMQIETNIISLYQKYLSGIQESEVPWLLHIEQVRLQTSERDPS